MYGNGYSMAIVLDHRSTATSLTGNWLEMKVTVYITDSWTNGTTLCPLARPPAEKYQRNLPVHHYFCLSQTGGQAVIPILNKI